MLGTVLLISVIVFGYFNLSPWILIPATIMAAFIGLHYPAGKSFMLKEQGMYWQSFLYSLPFQSIFLAVLYGVGWGARALIN